jgi:sodium transport system ATP-binding protein
MEPGAQQVVAAGLRREWPRPGGPPIVAVADASFTVHAGEVLGLLGPNGAGKTTTLRMRATLIRPTAGTATIAGHDVTREPARVRASIGYLSATSGLPPRLTCTEAVRTFASLQGVRDPRAAADQAIARYGISEFADRFIEGLSTGMRQRLRVACAAVHEPPVLILDEPTAGLDVVAADALLQDIARAREAGAAVVFSTHVLREAERLCDRIAVIEGGRIRAIGTLPALLTQTGCDDLDGAFLALVRRE